MFLDKKMVSVPKVRITTSSRLSTIQKYVKGRASTGSGLTHKEQEYSVTESIHTIDSTVASTVLSSGVSNFLLTTANQTLWYDSTHEQLSNSLHLFSQKKAARLCPTVGQGISFVLERSVDHDSPTFKCFGRN